MFVIKTGNSIKKVIALNKNLIPPNFSPIWVFLSPIINLTFTDLAVNSRKCSYFSAGISFV
jgi:hypothetical protein